MKIAMMTTEFGGAVLIALAFSYRDMEHVALENSKAIIDSETGISTEKYKYSYFPQCLDRT
jgi:hypothetical protein